MHWVDLVIIGIVVLSALISFMRGFVREVMSLLVWVAAVAIGYKFYPVAVPLVEEYASFLAKDASLMNFAAGALIFLAALIVLGIISYLISNVLLRKPLGIGDRVLALVPGVGRGVLLVGILGVIVSVLGIDERPKDHPPEASYWSEEAQFWPQTAELSDWLMSVGREMINDLQQESPSEDTEMELDINAQGNASSQAN